MIGPNYLVEKYISQMLTLAQKWIILKVLIVTKCESIGVTEGEKSYDWHVNDNCLSNLKSLVRDSCLSLKLYTVKQKIYI